MAKKGAPVQSKTAAQSTRSVEILVLLSLGGVGLCLCPTAARTDHSVTTIELDVDLVCATLLVSSKFNPGRLPYSFH
jgi:hypothetical protein